jgi:cytoskeletal protein RodZ
MREIGLALKEGRLARGLEIGDIARSTCISAHYLKAMEEGNFKTIPSVFDKGYLKLYARALDMDTKPLLALYEQEKSGTAALPSRSAQAALTKGA